MAAHCRATRLRLPLFPEWSRARPLLLVAARLAGTVVPLAAPAAADSGPVPLGVSRLGRIVVEQAHSRVFLSWGPGGSGVQVIDLAGRRVATLGGLPDANGLALTQEGPSLWWRCRPRGWCG